MNKPIFNKQQEIQNKFHKLLKQHGYGFQYAVLKKMEEIFIKQEIWTFEVAELPVGYGNHETRIDFVLKKNYEDLYLIAECKRVNPSYSDWCFVKAPYTARNRSFQGLIIENIKIHLENVESKDQITGMKYFEHQLFSTGLTGDDRSNIYHLGLEVKRSSNSGENNPHSKNAIQNASGQVMRGLNGFIEILPKIYSKSTGSNIDEIYSIRLIPVIFTTATLWVSDIDLKDADIQTGEILSLPSLKEAKWLFYQFPVSPSLKNEYGSNVFRSLSDLLHQDSTRTIAIVNHDGIDDFFDKFQYMLT